MEPAKKSQTKQREAQELRRFKRSVIIQRSHDLLPRSLSRNSDLSCIQYSSEMITQRDLSKKIPARSHQFGIVLNWEISKLIATNSSEWSWVKPHDHKFVEISANKFQTDLSIKMPNIGLWLSLSEEKVQKLSPIFGRIEFKLFPKKGR